MYWDGDGDGGWGWGWLVFMPLLWIVLIGLVVWAVVRLTPLRLGTASTAFSLLTPDAAACQGWTVPAPAVTGVLEAAASLDRGDAPPRAARRTVDYTGSW